MLMLRAVFTASLAALLPFPGDYLPSKTRTSEEVMQFAIHRLIFRYCFT
jgi:hypothetical protein